MGTSERGIECAIKQNPDMELAAVFTRRNPETVSVLTEGAPVCRVEDAAQWKDKIDVIDPVRRKRDGSAGAGTPEYVRMFNVIDSF